MGFLIYYCRTESAFNKDEEPILLIQINWIYRTLSEEGQKYKNPFSNYNMEY